MVIVGQFSLFRYVRCSKETKGSQVHIDTKNGRDRVSVQKPYNPNEVKIKSERQGYI